MKTILSFIWLICKAPFVGKDRAIQMIENFTGKPISKEDQAKFDIFDKIQQKI